MGLPPFPEARPGRISVLHLSAADSMLHPNLLDQLRHLRGAGYAVHTASIDGPLGRRMRDEEGFPWTPLPLTREFAPLSDWRALRFIENFCRQHRFDIVHTHTPKGNLIGQWAARRAGVPIVLQTLHGFYFHENMPWLRRKMWVAIERFSARHSDHILSQNSEDVATAALENICPSERVSLLGNGIDLARFKPLAEKTRAARRAELGWPPDALVVGMVGRFVAEKGFPEFLKAAELLVAQFPKLRLLAVGRKLASERAGERWAPSQVGALAGKLQVLTDRDDMPELFGCMDVHVLPSHREGFPRALMEGAAAGLPQVATDIRGCRQTVEDGRTGLLVNVSDVAALREGIAALLQNEPQRKEMGAAARRKALAEFDQARVFEKVSACYQRLLQLKTSRSQ
jgi:glycosyltransferase involved in cell wall biosynthesis